MRVEMLAVMSVERLCLKPLLHALVVIRSPLQGAHERRPASSFPSVTARVEPKRTAAVPKGASA